MATKNRRRSKSRQTGSTTATVQRGIKALNPAQAKAASLMEGPALIIAGAGTGKTLTLVHRLANLIQMGVPPESILLLTFTRRAAQEMGHRATRLLGSNHGQVAGGTFHSFANHMLRRFGAAINIAPNFTVLDQGDAFEILGGIRTDLKLAGRGGFPRKATIGNILSKAINKKVTIKHILTSEYPHLSQYAAQLTKIAQEYRKFKEQRQLLDFDDLLGRLLQLLEKNADIQQKICERYQYVMVDEYQDTNVIQARITKLLAGQKRNVLVVGDDAQSIYAFRGACYANLFDFKKRFTGCELVTLEQNYRSTQPILDVANALMGQMSKSFRKNLFTDRKDGEQPLLVQAADEEEQARFVATKVSQYCDEGIPLSEMAVLFRAGFHSYALELRLEGNDIPYVKYGGFKFMETAHIKDVLAHLRVLANPDDDLSAMRILTLCDGVGRVAATKIIQSQNDASLADTLDRHKATVRTRESLGRLTSTLKSIEKLQASPTAMLQEVLNYYGPVLESRYDDWPKRARDLEQLVALVQRHGDIENMLAELTLDPPTTTTSTSGSLASPGPEERLVLSTMHSAKGLEWKVVFVIQAIDGCIPMFSQYDDVDEDKLDEELRLFYVATTRAKNSLYIVYPRDTARGSYFGWASVSQFVEDLPEGLLVEERATTLLRTVKKKKAKVPKKTRKRKTQRRGGVSKQG